MRVLLACFLVCLPVWLGGCGGGLPHVDVTINGVTAQPILQPGAVAQIVFSPNQGFSGSVDLSATTITLTSTGGITATATATAQGASSGNQISLNFTVPALNITTPTAFTVSVSGQTTKSQPFSSSGSFSVTVYPGSSLTAVTPSSGAQGQTVSVTLTGQNTNFVQGQTQASFGAGIAVNGAGAGLPALITVNSATSATASLVIAAGAAVGARDVSVSTQSQSATLKSGFSVTAALLPLVPSAGGPYTGYSGRTVQFDASKSSDPNGGTLSYAWNFGDGATGTGVQPTHTYTKAGTFTVQLTLTDTLGGSATANTTATITTLANPVAAAGGPYTGTTGQPVSFDGSGSSDPNGGTLTYAWNFGDGGTGAGAKVTHTYASSGTYTATLTVTDNFTLSATATATVTVSNAVQNPVANAGGPYSGTAGTSLTFDGSGSSDPQGQTLTYAWDFGDGTVGTGVRPSHAYSAAGTYTVHLSVTNTSNLSASATATATIAKAIAAPVANAGGPYTGTAGTSLTLDGSGSSDPQGQTLTYAWDFGDSTTGTGIRPAHTYAAAGTYTVRLTVTNTSNLSASATSTATVTASIAPPVANAGGPYTGTAGTALALDGSASTDPQGQTLTYSWAFGDGSTGAGAKVTHTYAAAGTFTATLTVTNTSNLSAMSNAAVTIRPQGGLTASPGGPYTGTVSQAVTFNGAGSSDPKGETLTYAWDFGDGNTATGVSPSHAYTAAGTFNVSLTVTNTDSATASATTTATIADVLIAVLNGPYTGNVSQQISFDASKSTSPNSDPLTYAWTFGDGGAATGVQATHAYAAGGTFTVKLTVTDTATNATASATATANITSPPVVLFTTPAQGALFNTTTVAVAGTADKSVQSVTVNGVTASLSGGTFSATVPVREGVNILTATGLDASGNPGTAATSVTVDLTPPILSVLQPTEGSTVTTQQVSIAGMVTDQVTGTVSAGDVTVTVNGQAATVANRSFMLSNVLLVPGANTLQLVATDKAGNSVQSTLHVTYANTAAQQRIVVLSGDGQSGQIGSVLPQPLAVQLVSGTGSPVPNRALTFTVTASDGTVESLPLQNQTLSLVTDAQGKASVLFQLGSRAGVGINQVTVSSPGFVGNAVFSETTTPGAPTFIHEFLGNNQRGILGQPLAQAFQTIVQDSGGDPIANVPVVFTVTSGDGLFAGQTSTTVMSNSDGRAMATLTLGQQEGVNNNTVTADFSGDPNSAVTFYASSYSSGAVANTSVSGVVMDNAGNPVPNATVRLSNTMLSTVTDSNGHFAIPGAPVGTVTLLVDGSTTTLAETLPSLSFLLQDLPGQNNTLNMPVYLPIIDTGSAVTAGGNTPATLTLAGMPGVALTIAPNSVTFPDGSHVGQLTLSQVKSDLVPMPPPNGVVPGFAWTIQPAGTKFTTPVSITIPNTEGFPPGQVQEFYQYDHDLEQFVSVGTLRVSPDGSVMNSDPGFGITKAGWATPGSHPPPGSCGNSCDDNNVCTTDSQNSQTCACTHKPKGGGCGNNPAPGRNSCQQPGQCVNGQCSSKPKPAGSGCDDGQFCTDPDYCGPDGACHGVAKPDDILPFGGYSFQADLNSATLRIQSFMRQFFGGAGDNFSAQFGVAGQTKNVCCESQKKFVHDSQGTYSAQGGINSPPYFLNFPPWSINLPGLGGGYGVYVSFGLNLTGSLEVNNAKCKDYSCIVGTVSLGGTATLGGGTVINDPITGAPYIKVAIEGNVGITAQFQNSGDCKSVTLGIGLNAVTINLVAQFESGSPVPFTIPLWTPIGAVPIADTVIPLTDF